MTLQHCLKSIAAAVIGCAALSTQVQAESTLIPPDEAAALARAQAEEVEAAALVQDADPTAAEPEAAEKASESHKGKKSGKAAAGSHENAEEVSVDHTASLPLDPSGRARGADAAKASVLKPLIVRYAEENGLPFELANAVVRLESRYNPAVRNGPNVGLTQINVRTAQSLGYTGSLAGLLDAETNLRYGLKYLAQAYRLAGGDTCGTILRYQFGHRTTSMTGATRAYCAKVKVITAAAD